jgi:hypothetical protein
MDLRRVLRPSRRLLWLALAFAIPAAAQPVEVPVGAHVDWSAEEDPNPSRYRVGPVSLTLRGEKTEEGANLVQPFLTVEMPGLSPIEVQGSLSWPGLDHRVTVARWDETRLYVLFQSFTGGAHCCNAIQLVVPEEGRLRVVDMGLWDGDYLDDLPTDLDGDGRLDFVFRDDRFLYVFASYAESLTPLMVMNVVNGRMADVSHRPAFRPLFVEALEEASDWCAPPGRDDAAVGASNGACAGYVATAARAGRLDEAWARMFAAYDRDSDWPLPQGCRTNPPEGECPAEDMILFDNYPDALRHFLVEHSYVDRGWTPPDRRPARPAD